MRSSASEESSTGAIFLQELREGTAFWHRQLEDLDQSKAILAEEVTPQQYLLYLKTMYGFIKPFESAVYPQLTIPDIGRRYKTALLEKDMAQLGMGPDAIAEIPLYRLPATVSNAEAMGMMYVIEGSTLGGAVIYKHIHKVLGLDAQNGASYFQPYGQQAGSYWKTFREQLVAFSLGQQKEQEVIAAATQTFKNIHDWFLHTSLKQPLPL